MALPLLATFLLFSQVRKRIQLEKKCKGKIYPGTQFCLCKRKIWKLVTSTSESLSREDLKNLELEISSCRLTTAQSRCLARSMSTAIQACGRSRYVNSSYVRSSHYLVRLRGVSRSNVPTLCKRLFDITDFLCPHHFWYASALIFGHPSYV